MFEDSVRPLPSAEECEKSVLSNIFQKPEFCLQEAVEAGVTKDSFHIHPHGLLFDYIRRRLDQDLPCDLIEVTQALRSDGILENIGGPAYITDLWGFSPTEQYFQYHVGLLRNSQALRAVIENCTQAVNKAYSCGAKGMEVLSETIRTLEEVQNAQDSAGENKTKSIKDLLGTVVDNIEARISGENQEWLPTPWRQVRFSRGGCCFVGARPSKGKSAFLLNLAEHLAIVCGEPACVMSLEMDPHQLAERALSSQSGIATTEKTDKITEKEMMKISAAAAKLSGAPLYISDMPGATADELIVEMRKVQRQHGVNTFFVDYIQDIGPSSNEESHRDKLRIDNALTKMDVARKKLKMTHVFAAQLDRDADGKTPREMTMRLLSDTSKLEKIAYQVLFLGDRKDADPMAEVKEMEAAIVKNRCGSSGYFPMLFHKKLTLWTDDEEKPCGWTD